MALLPNCKCWASPLAKSLTHNLANCCTARFSLAGTVELSLTLGAQEWHGDFPEIKIKSSEVQKRRVSHKRCSSQLGGVQGPQQRFVQLAKAKGVGSAGYRGSPRVRLPLSSAPTVGLPLAPPSARFSHGLLIPPTLCEALRPKLGGENIGRRGTSDFAAEGLHQLLAAGQGDEDLSYLANPLPHEA